MSPRWGAFLASITRMHWLARLYARRIINVNINIVLAGLLALPPVVLVVYLVQRWGLDPAHMLRVGPIRFPAIGAITLGADVIFDFSIYLGLHWLANHHPWRNRLLAPADKLLGTADKLLEPAHKGLSFIHDAGLVQFERAVLSPALYAMWIGIQSLLIGRGIGAEWATTIGCICGISTARTLHTVWMLNQERRARKARAAARAAAAAIGAAPAPAPPDQSNPKRISIVR